jgi:hypothetical protein
MKTIKLNDEELEYMIASYQVELSYAQDEVEHIKGMLRKIKSVKKAKSAEAATPVVTKKTVQVNAMIFPG